jgi:hypothetical protein
MDTLKRFCTRDVMDFTTWRLPFREWFSASLNRTLTVPTLMALFSPGGIRPIMVEVLDASLAPLYYSRGRETVSPV